MKTIYGSYRRDLRCIVSDRTVDGKRNELGLVPKAEKKRSRRRGCECYRVGRVRPWAHAAMESFFCSQNCWFSFHYWFSKWPFHLLKIIIITKGSYEKMRIFRDTTWVWNKANFRKLIFFHCLISLINSYRTKIWKSNLKTSYYMWE